MSEQRNISPTVTNSDACLEALTAPAVESVETYQGAWWFLLIVISLGWFMSALDTTVVNVALKNIGEDLQTNVSGLQWIVDGYALVFASLLLTAGGLIVWGASACIWSD